MTGIKTLKPKKSWKHYLREWILFLLTVLIIIIGLDIYRMPDGRALNTATLMTIDQQTITFNPAEKQPIILYFWGSWCVYCRHTSPMINTLFQEGYPVVSVALQSGDENEVRTYLEKHHFHFPTVNDPDGEISRAFSIVATPTIAIIKENKMSIATSGFTSKYGLKFRYWLAKIQG